MELSLTASVLFLGLVGVVTYLAATNHSETFQTIYDAINMLWDTGRVVFAIILVAFAVGTGEPALVLFAGFIVAFAALFLVYDFYSPLNGRYR